MPTPPRSQTRGSSSRRTSTMKLPTAVVTLDDHTRGVNHVTEIEDSGLVATSCVDGHVRVFNSSTGALHAVGALGPRASLVSLGGELLAHGGDDDGSLRVWNMTTGKRVARVYLGGKVCAIGTLGKGGLAVGAGSDLVYVRRNKDNEFKETHRVTAAHSGPICDISVYGNRFATMAKCKTVKVWDCSNWQLLASMDGHGGTVQCVSIGKDWLVSGAQDKTIRAYSLEKLRFVRALRGVHTKTIVSLALFRGHYVMSFSVDLSAAISNLNSGDVFVKIDLGFSPFQGIALKDGRFAATGYSTQALIFSNPLRERARGTRREAPANDEEKLKAPSVRVERLMVSVHDSLGRLDFKRRTGTGGTERSAQVDEEIHVPVADEPQAAGDSGRADVQMPPSGSPVEEDLERSGHRFTLDHSMCRWIRRMQSSNTSQDVKNSATEQVRKRLNSWFIERSRISVVQGSPDDQLGAGGYGSVYRALLRDKCVPKQRDGSSQGREVAMKVLHEEVAMVSQRTEFFREATLLSRLNHPNVIKFIGAWWPEEGFVPEEWPYSQSGTGRRKPFIVTELMTGNLRQAQRDGLLADGRRQIRVLLDVATAVEFLHSKQVLHQDISPENVLIRSTGEQIECVKISDFGVSRVMRDAASSSRTPSNAGAEGRIHYMAPEAILRSCPAGYSVDVWSFGVLCTFVALGRTAFSDKDNFFVYETARNRRLGSLSRAWAREIGDNRLRDLCVSCFFLDPDSRPTMAGICASLRRILDSF